MDKQIPIYFDSVIVASPIEQVSESNPNLGRLRVGVFTKYGNRNGSYITEEVANQLIESAIQGNTPVVGFFDPEHKAWASHTGPTLANGYGYVEDFIGWEPLQDTDGVTREYAVFSVVVFTNYFEEAKTIVGQNQSMELDINSITGDWANIEDTEYYVYTTAKIMGLCIIGSHEPCFSASSFFSKNDDEYKTQYEKFEALLSELKAAISNLDSSKKGGEQPMNELDTAVQTSAQEPVATEPEFAINDEPAAATEPAEEPVPEVEETQPVEPEEPAAEPEAEENNAEFEALQVSFDELTANYEQAQARIAELETANNDMTEQLNAANARITELENNVSTYAAQIATVENERKNTLIEKYTKILDEEEISPIREHVCDYSYDEINSKLAICFANKKLTDTEAEPVVPQPEVPVNSFALFMEKYRKN